MLFFTLPAVLSAQNTIAPSDTDALIFRMAEGDKAALSELYSLTRAAVYSFSLSITKNEADSEDILHETYIKAWAASAAYKSVGNPMAWLLTITKNLSLMKIREHKRLHDLKDDEWGRISVTDSTHAEDDRHFLHSALKILTDEERQIIMLHAVAGIKHREISALTDIPLSTVLSKYSRALKKLRIHMEGADA